MSQLVIEEEFPATQNAPEQVFQRLAASFCFALTNEADELGALVIAGKVRERAKIHFVNDCVVRRIFHKLTDDVFFRLQLGIQSVAVLDVQHLRHARFVGTFAFTRNDPVRPSKG